MNTYKKIDIKDLQFEDKPIFRKVASISKANVRIVEKKEIIETKHPNIKETENEALPGDFVVTRSGNDAYVIKSKKFHDLYEDDQNNPGFYRSKSAGYAIFLKEKVTIDTPWGTEQKIDAGGILFKSTVTREIYGNQQKTFEEDFAREAKDGSLMPLSKPFQEQKEWAVQKGENFHLIDIKEREAFYNQTIQTSLSEVEEPIPHLRHTKRA
jgi:hypothetical protein